MTSTQTGTSTPAPAATRYDTAAIQADPDVRDQWLASGMETGVNDGYAAIDALLAEGGL